MNCINCNFLNESIRPYTNIIGSFLLYNCYFKRFNNFLSDGGILYFNGIYSILNITQCHFNYCSSNGVGGTIYYKCSSTGSKINFNKICSSHCFSSISHHFACIMIGLSNTFKINISLMSISKCSPILTSISRVVEFEGAFQYINEYNSSYNKAKEISGLLSDYPSSFYGLYMTFLNNSASSNSCFCSWWNSNHIILNSNFILNDSPLSHGVISIYYSSSYIISNSYFYKNKDTLFYLESGSFLKVKFSHIYLNLILTNGLVNLESNYFEETNFNIRTFFNCMSNYSLFQKKTVELLKIMNFLVTIVFL